MTKQSVTNPIKHTITVTKVVHVANAALRGSSTPSSTSIPPSVSTVVPSNREVSLWSPVCAAHVLASVSLKDEYQAMFEIPRKLFDNI